MANFPGAGADDFIYRPGFQPDLPALPIYLFQYWDWDRLEPQRTGIYYFVSDGGLASSSNSYVDKGYLTGLNFSSAEQNYNGQLAHAFSVDFYNRIHINPNPVDFGSLLEETTLQLEVWNAFFEPSDIYNYIGVNTTGITFGDGELPPPTITIPALYNHTVDVIASTDGPGVINGELLLQFTATTYGKPAPVVKIIGRRSKLFPFVTSWEKDPVERLEWKTNVVETDGWEERRFRLRQWPRRFFQFGIGAVGIGAADLKAALISSQAEEYGLPLWMYDGKLSQKADPGDTRIYLDTTDNDFQIGGNVMIYEYGLRFETVEVEAIADTYLDLKVNKAVAQSWKTGTTVYPVRLTRIDSNVSMRAESGNTLVATVNLTGVDQEKTFDSQPFPTYLGYPRITFIPNWASGRTLSYQRKIEEIDLGIYPKEYFSRAYRYGEVQDFEWFLKGRDSVSQFKAFAQYMAGRHGSAWVPSWHEDFKLLSDYATGDTILTVQGNFASKFMQANIAEPTHVRMRLKDGREYCAQLISAAANASNSLNDDMRLKFGWPVEFTTGWVENFSLLTLVRLSTESVSITWKTPQMALSKTSFTYVPNQPE